MSADEADEDALIDAVLQGDKSAFSTLIRRHHSSLKMVAFSITRDSTAMDDALQDSYIKAYRALPNFDRRSSFKTWMSRIVHNTCIDEVRRAKRATRLTSNSDAEADEAAAVGVADPVDRLDIDRAFGLLPVSQRVAVLLVDAQGFTYEQAAMAMDVPQGTLATHVRQGRSALRRLLRVEEDDR